MSRVHIEERRNLILGNVFLLSNKLQAMGDQILGDEMTLTQWLLTLAIAQFGDAPPTLSQVAELTGTSRQNVKQVAVKLEKRGFLRIEKDGLDMRAIRLRLTESSSIFWNKHQGEIKQLFNELFKELSEDDIDSLNYCLSRLCDSIVKMEKYFSEKAIKILR